MMYRRVISAIVHILYTAGIPPDDSQYNVLLEKVIPPGRLALL